MTEDIDQVQEIVGQIIEFFVNYSFSIIGGIIVLIAGFIVGGILARVVTKICKKSDIDITLERFFAGLTTAQAAQTLEISTTTAENDWAYARSWLRLEMTGDGGNRA